MKLKGINPLEQHADKIVLGVVGLVAAGAVVLQLLPPKTIKVGNEDKTPGTAFEPVVRAAKDLQARVDAAEPKMPDVPAMNLSGKLAIANDLARPSAPRVSLGPAPQIAKAGAIAAGPATGSYASPEVPATSGVQAAPYSATVHPVEKLMIPELAKLLPEAQPFDIAAVSIEAAFDGSALRAALEHDPDGSGPLEAIPRSWWKDALGPGMDMVAIVGMEVERELVRNPDGSTPTSPSIQIVKPMPGRMNGFEAWATGVRSVGDVPGAVSTLLSQAEYIERPAFYATIAGVEWQAPSKVLSTGNPAARDRQVQRLRAKLVDLDADIKRLEERLAQLPAAETPGETRRSEQPRTGGGGGGGGGKGGGGPAAPRQTNQPTREEPRGDRRTIERNIANLTKVRSEVVKDLIELGEVVEGEEPEAPVVNPEDAARPMTMLENPKVQMWTHDLTAQPGATYRYRTRAVINNPLFGRNLQESQKELGAQSLLRGEWSAWSDPVTVDPTSVFFVSAAEESGVLTNRPRATGELFQFYYGFYRKAQVNLEPGDMVFGDARLPELRLADMAKLQALVDSGKPVPGLFRPDAPPAMPMAPGTRGPGKSGPGGRAPNLAPMEREGERSPRGTGVPGVTQPTDPQGKIEWPEWMTGEVGKTLPLSLDSVLLDVLSVPGAGGRQQSQAVLKAGSGSLTIRLPELDRKDPLYERVEMLANKGETQGVQPPKPVEKPSLPPPPGRRDPSTPQSPGRTGGGGGGGG